MNDHDDFIREAAVLFTKVTMGSNGPSILAAALQSAYERGRNDERERWSADPVAWAYAVDDMEFDVTVNIETAIRLDKIVDVRPLHAAIMGAKEAVE